MQPKREFISDSLRKAVLERDRHMCRYCGATQESGAVLVLDHVYPVAKGGETSFENLVAACWLCNTKKKAKVGIWPRPVDHFPLRKYVYDTQVQTSEILIDFRILVVAHMRQLMQNEGKPSLLDIGRVALKLDLDVFDVCRVVDTEVKSSPPFHLRVALIGVARFLERSAAYDKVCKVQVLL